MYQIARITEHNGVIRTDDEARRHIGCIAAAKMEEGCVLLHCRRDNEGHVCDRYIRTSLVQSWDKNSNTGDVVVETMNSIYTLQLVR